MKKDIKKDRKGKKKYPHYRLCESYRLNDKVRHRTIINVGRLDDLKDYERKILADRIEQTISGQLNIFLEIPGNIEKYAQDIVKKIIDKNSLDIIKYPEKDSIRDKDFVEVDINSVENHDIREIGAEWITKQTMDKLGIADLLISLGYDKRSIAIAHLNWISRTINPLSELGTEKWLNRSTALCELFNLDSKKISRFHLYEAGRKLYKNKDDIGKYLSSKTNQLFGLNDKIILYDLTNSYFEGRMSGSEKSKYGRSKEKRTDAKIIALALVTNIYGFIKYSKIYRGNISDCKTLETTIQELNNTLSATAKKPMIVIDAGIATEDNLEKIKSSKYNFDYVAVSRKRSYDDNFWHGSQEEQIKLADKKTKLTLKSTRTNEEVFLLCHSEAKEKKEQGIYEKRQEKFEKELQLLHDGFPEKRKLKKYVKVLEKIGRLKEKYKVGQLYNITVEKDGENATKINFKRNEKSEEKKSQYGDYVLRTNRLDLNNGDISQIHRSLTTIENSFRSMKSHLGLRPIHHQKDENSDAHLFVTVIAYHFVAGIIKRLRAKGINDNWDSVRKTLNSHRRVTTNFNTKEDVVINIRQNIEANLKQNQIYKALKIFSTSLNKVRYLFNMKKDG
ncbi:IS1634 family transposase [Candidatus Parcubacteria bacterium]|nr:IS1634 family transposase [Candidatus Parcubacteria bacterium]